MNDAIKSYVKKNFNKVLSRKIKGYAFISYPLADGTKSPQDYRAKVAHTMENDLMMLSLIEFTDKYSSYCY